MQDAIRTYFDNFKYQNTTLNDFIECVQQGLNKNKKQVNIKFWTDSWLTKSGVNELRAILDEDAETKTYSINIQQSYPNYGDQVYHEQKIDVAIYDD